MDSCCNKAPDTIADPTLLAVNQSFDIDRFLKSKPPSFELIISLLLAINQQLNIPFQCPAPGSPILTTTTFVPAEMGCNRWCDPLSVPPEIRRGKCAFHNRSIILVDDQDFCRIRVCYTSTLSGSVVYLSLCGFEVGILGPCGRRPIDQKAKNRGLAGFVVK